MLVSVPGLISLAGILAVYTAIALGTYFVFRAIKLI